MRHCEKGRAARRRPPARLHSSGQRRHARFYSFWLERVPMAMDTNTHSFTLQRAPPLGRSPPRPALGRRGVARASRPDERGVECVFFLFCLLFFSLLDRKQGSRWEARPRAREAPASRRNTRRRAESSGGRPQGSGRRTGDE